MFDHSILPTVVQEVWTAKLMAEGLLWTRAPVGFQFMWTVEHDCYVATLYNPGKLYSYMKISQPGLRSARSLAEYLDREMLALKQLHFFNQAAQRGGYY